MNFTAYTEWSTMLLPQQENPPQLGDFITLRVKLPGGLDYTFSPVVITLENENHFAWWQKTGFKGVFDGEHHFMLTELENGETLLYNYEHYSGSLSPIFKRLPMMKDAPEGFVAMNDEIKRRAESLKWLILSWAINLLKVSLSGARQWLWVCAKVW